MASVFSRIIAGEIPSYKVAENERFYAFLDIHPLAEGHTLVVPKQEVDYFYDLDDRTLGEMMVFAKHVADKIRRETGCKKVATVVLGLEVPHAFDPDEQRGRRRFPTGKAFFHSGRVCGNSP